MNFELAGSYGTFVILLSGISTAAFLLSAYLDNKVGPLALRLFVIFTWTPLVYSVAARTVGLGLLLVWPAALVLGSWTLFTTIFVQDAPAIAAGAAIPFLLAAAFGLALSADNPYDFAAARLHGHVALIFVAIANLAAASCFAANAFRSRQNEPQAAVQPPFTPPQSP